MRQIVFFIIIAITAACDSLVNEVDFSRLPQTEKRFVLNCYLSPQDSLISAKVHLLKLAVGNDSNYGSEIIVKDAKVYILEGTKKVELVFNPKELLYMANADALKIESGKTYKLEAIDAQGQKYTAETTVPQPVPYQIQKDGIVKTPSQFTNNYTWSIPVRWTAPPKSYFRIGLVTISENKQTLPDGKTTTYISHNGYLSLILEKNLSESPVNMNKDFKLNIYDDNNFHKAQSNYLKFLRVDENYKNYHESLNANTNNENPFAEPTLISGNIANGYGCFGSYVESISTLEIK